MKRPLLCFLGTILIASIPVPPAVAQVINGPLLCNTSVSTVPTLRGEGYAEQVGDITLSCTGGTAPALGASIPQVNISIFYNTSVTSRLLPQPAVSNSLSEALLIIDEPGSGLLASVPNFGPAAPQNLCTTPLQG